MLPPVLPVLPALPPLKKPVTEKDRNEYLTPSDAPKSFGQFDEDSVTTSGAGPLIFGETQEIFVDLTEADSDVTAKMFGAKTDIDLMVHDEPKIDDSFLTPDSSVDLGGKTDPDIGPAAKNTAPIEKKAEPLEKPVEKPKAADVPAKKAEPKPAPKAAPKAEPKPEPKLEKPKPKSQIQVDQQKPLAAPPTTEASTSTSAPPPAPAPGGVVRAPVPVKGGVVQRALPSATEATVSETPTSAESPASGAHTLISQEQVVIKPSAQGRRLQPDPQPAPPPPPPDIFPLASDSADLDIFPIAGEEPKPRPAVQAVPRPGTQAVGKPSPKKKPLTDDDYDKMLTNFVSSQMPVNQGNANDPAVLQAVEELKRAEEAKKKAAEERRKAEERAALEKAKKAKLEQAKKKSIVQKIGTMAGLTLKPALKKELEMEKPRGPVAAPRPEKERTWTEMVPVWFWAVFGFFIICTFLLGLILLLSG